MAGEFGKTNFFLYLLGLLLMLGLPIFGILAIWNFSLPDISELFGQQSSSNYSADQNFEVVAGEDALLTSHLISGGESGKITKKRNPAIFLKIDSADIEGPIVYGFYGEEKLREGFWHYPLSKYAGERGDTLIFGHRRFHLPPAKDTFYNLNKVQVNDRIEIKLKDGTWLEYTVTEIKVVEPEYIDSMIFENARNFLLHLVTCTPLGTDKQRLIVTARKTF